MESSDGRVVLVEVDGSGWPGIRRRSGSLLSGGRRSSLGTLPGICSRSVGFGYGSRPASRRRRMISSGKGRPSGPDVRLVPEVGTGSPPGNVGAVVPLGGRRMTSLVGSVG